MRPAWALDPDVLYLNHGTVGAPPRRALEAQQKIRDEIERQPSDFMLRRLSSIRVGVENAQQPHMRVAAEAVAKFFGARSDDLVFVDNITTAANAVLRSATFAPGDEILITDEVYGAIGKTAEYVMRRCGGTVRTTELPREARDPQAFVDAIAGALTPRTRIAVVEHIAARSAVILPLQAIARACRARGVAVLADGAHVPGAIALDIPALGVDWYAANLHKWAWSPRSLGILWAPPERQADLHPTTISWGLDQGFAAEFDWVGTKDPSAALAAPAALAYMEELGVDKVRSWNHALAWEAGEFLAARFGTVLPADEPFVGAMVTVPLPAAFGTTMDDASRLRDRLLFEHRIELQVDAAHGGVRIRVSAQIYNERADIERLAAVLATLAD
jgi:isopenicillin-N epimerase